MVECDRYKDIASQAAEAERLLYFEKASSLWHQACPLAVNEKNRNWAICRARYCENRDCKWTK
ncbi:ANR family transcriptional regulator [Photobacterium damselae subsp. damselae]|uniref:ANR family transcriptional regulator n=1 Tax=Photobacterium damselae TaxID=38293 RepID=UPI001F1601B5|nr:ANR family transcriptional regulator [Photobacterium damselae]UJZ96359.1 ANR family transcriptional regulator [Photobacterium damselae subsp. damselae]UJZ99736.1 ANR family transcriptional regulator [Photobacterium damselae subsp. damselae]UKA08855.1 ANR family transcriptional regulator [Photobacterium damselae subsp. damselae]UKA12692.1 ANR family transcriptional regulator [Photobacterium damselae subsp. damselae]UKA23942.1 ANR family transcriptional regulator [Photobacterium damselae subs